VAFGLFRTVGGGHAPALGFVGHIVGDVPGNRLADGLRTRHRTLDVVPYVGITSQECVIQPAVAQP
jgi:hypothetical protein